MIHFQELGIGKVLAADLKCFQNTSNDMLCVVQVIIQHHDSVVTSSDLGLALHCQYDLGNKTVTNGLDLEVNGEIEAALVENGKVSALVGAFSVIVLLQ